MKHYDNQLGEERQLDSKLSAVAFNPKKSFLLIIIGVGALIFVLYNFMWKTNQAKVEDKPEVSKKITTEETPKITNLEVNTAPILPDPPEITAPEAPAIEQIPDPIPADVSKVEPTMTPPPEDIVNVNETQYAPITPPIVANRSSGANLQERRKSPIIKMGGGNAGKNGPDDKTTTNNQNDYSPTISSNFNPSKTNFSQQKITKIGDMKYIIAQGKIIDGVLETAINTEIPSPVRALITRDVYSEADKNILIPKGSRLIGNFASDSGTGKVRVAISWSRIIRPDGIDINVDSPGVDRLGKGGSAAEIDAKIADILASSLVSAMIQIGVAEGSQKLTDKLSPNNTNTSANISASTVANAVAAANGGVPNAVLQAGITAGTNSSNVASSVISAMTSAAISNNITLSPAAIQAGIAAGSVNNIAGQITQTTVNGLNSTTTSASPAQLATQNALTNFGSSLQSIQKNFTETKPSLHLNQGTEIKIFVNRDLIFSQNYVYRKRNIE